MAQNASSTIFFVKPLGERFASYAQKIPTGWVATWVVIYVVFIVMDAFLPTTFLPITALKYLGILLCLVYTWRRFPQDYLLNIAFAFTLLADTILAFNNASIIGVFVFCMVQFFHFARLRNTSNITLLIYFVAALAVFFFGVIQHIPPIFIIAAIYGGTLLLNFLTSISWYRRTHSVAATCALVGFTLFWLCDICVAISYLSATAVLPGYLYDFANFFAWFFYYPSQIFISNSSKTMIQ